MPDFRQIPNFPLKVIFITHFMLINMCLLGYWRTGSYMFYNSLFILLLLWAIKENESEEPLQLAITINAFSIVMDVLILVMCYPDSHSVSERFSAAMAIIHLAVRPFTTFCMWKIHGDRTGNSNFIGGIMSSGRSQTYEDIDRTSQQPPNNTGGYNFAPQQI